LTLARTAEHYLLNFSGGFPQTLRSENVSPCAAHAAFNHPDGRFNLGGPVKFLSTLFCLSVALILVSPAFSAQTVAVGNCKSQLVSYPTISAALGAVAANATVLICPGTYPEQISITQAVNLKGIKGTNGDPVISVPAGGLVGSYPAQVLAEQTGFDEFGPVNLSHLVVDGAGSGVDCSIGLLFGIEYVFASGTIDNVEVRNQNPGGCGEGISLNGDAFTPNTVNLSNSRIHNFDNTGVSADSSGGTGFVVNLTSNWISATSPSVQAGVLYNLAQGVATRNLIQVGGQNGLVLDNFFCCMNASENTIIGSNVGIYMGGSYTFATTTVTHNSLLSNGTGVFIYQAQGIDIVSSNAIVQSAAAGIDVDCSPQTTVKNNSIFKAPVGIADVISGDTVSGNLYYGVTTKTTTCP
jgi:Periplasmic copper-binding protein (NosD)